MLVDDGGADVSISDDKDGHTALQFSALGRQVLTLVSDVFLPCLPRQYSLMSHGYTSRR